MCAILKFLLTTWVFCKGEFTWPGQTSENNVWDTAVYWGVGKMLLFFLHMHSTPMVKHERDEGNNEKRRQRRRRRKTESTVIL
jgi:hypothetical protein